MSAINHLIRKARARYDDRHSGDCECDCCTAYRLANMLDRVMLLFEEREGDQR